MKKRLSPQDQVYTILLNATTALQSRVDFGPGARHRSGKILKQLGSGAKILMLSQKSLPEPWMNDLNLALEKEQFQVHRLVLPDGEEAKTLEQISLCWEQMQKAAFTRSDTVVAIGGGAVTDLAGFAASTYLRGVKLLLLPTTLLAQVDASIGGKTGINLLSGKNLAGSFYFPQSVVADPEFLSTLPERELKSGMGEIVKYAFIEKTIAENTEYQVGPRPLFELLKENFKSGISYDNPILAPIISCCIRMKLAVVAKDPFEGRLRRCLNLGHTLGHGIEKVTGFKVSHGEAVSIGTVFAFKLSLHKRMIGVEDLELVQDLIQNMHLPYQMPESIDPDKLLQAMVHDKKRSGNAIKFVLPEKQPGRVNLDTEISVDDLERFIKENG